MIPSKSTNTVCFSELLKTKEEYSSSYFELTKILDNHKIKHQLIKGTKDIWCRDYMPIQIDENKFVQFRYEPSYLKEELEIQSNPIEVCKANNIHAKFSTINLDGGNIVNWKNMAIITDRIFKENPEYSNHLKLVDEIEKLLEVEVIIIPQINCDLTGHVDGMVRFVGDNKILGNNRATEFKYWTTKMNQLLKTHGIDYIDIPSFYNKSKLYPYNAIGCYVNFLEVGNLIVIPIFETKDNKDQEVYDLFKQIYPNRILEAINFNAIGNHGGLLNYATWTSLTK